MWGCTLDLFGSESGPMADCLWTIRKPQKEGNILNNLATISFSKRSLLHAFSCSTNHVFAVLYWSCWGRRKHLKFRNIWCCASCQVATAGQEASRREFADRLQVSAPRIHVRQRPQAACNTATGSVTSLSSLRLVHHTSDIFVGGPRHHVTSGVSAASSRHAVPTPEISETLLEMYW
jgi:hypothetical protein